MAGPRAPFSTASAPGRRQFHVRMSILTCGARSPQKCLQFTASRFLPGAPTQTDRSHTHTLSTSLRQQVCISTGAFNGVPKGGNFRHPSRLMGEILLSKLSQHATNTPARLTHLEVDLTFIRGIFHQLYPSKAHVLVSSYVQQMQLVAGFGKPDASSCRMP